MSHATEGELHAWADGALAALEPERAERLAAHLRSCPDCRARLEEARGVRDRAAEILDGAFEGRVERPPFEAVRARAAAAPSGTGGPGSGRRGTPPLAWAASVVLAIGAGWLGHAVWSGAPSAPATVEAPARVADAVAERGAAGPGAASEDAAAGEPAAGEGRALADPRSVEPPPPDPPARSESDLAPRGRQASRAVSEREGTEPGERAAAEAVGQGAERQVAEAARPEPELEERALPVSALTTKGARADEAPAWLRVPAEDAARWLGGEPPRVPDLPVTDVAISSRGGVALARIGQRLPGGERIEVVVERIGDRDEAVARGLRAGAPEAAVASPADVADEERAKAEGGALEAEAGGFRVRILGPVATDSLRALLSRVR